MSAAYDINDWRYEVANGDTKLGFEEWCQHRKEAEPAEPCEGCAGRGLRLNQRGVIERCDTCNKYPDDWHAWMSANPQP